MADFRFYLGRQGVRGQKGEKGDTGFSPLITEKTNTKEEYVLHIQNETDEESFDTPNLKEGLVPEDMGGTYVRLNRETGKQYYGDIEEATETVKGVVKLEPDETILAPTSETSVITASQALSNYTKKTETQDLQEVVNTNTTSIEGLKTAKQDKLTAGENITIVDNVISSSGGDVTQKGDNTFTGTNTFKGSVTLGSLNVAENLNVTNTLTSNGEINAASVVASLAKITDLTNSNNKKYLDEEDVDNQTIQVVDGKLHANLDELGNEVNDLSGRVTANEADITTLQTDVNGNTSDILTLKNSVAAKQTKLTAGSNITLTDLTDGTVRIDASGEVSVPIATTTSAGIVKPDGTTVTIAEDGTISAVGGGSTSIPVASTTTLGGIKVGDNLTITEDGTLSASSGSAPDNMVTTDTEQEITGYKKFTYVGETENAIKPALKVNQLILGQEANISSTPAIAVPNTVDFVFTDKTNSISFYSSSEGGNNYTGIGLDGSAQAVIGTKANTLVLTASNRGGVVTISNSGLTYKDYYNKEYNLLSPTLTAIDGGDSTSS